MIIDKNRLMRNKAKKILKANGELLAENKVIIKMDTDIPQGEYHYRRRLNQNIKDRVASLTRNLNFRLEEVADLLDLLEERLKLDGNSLEDVAPHRAELKRKYGSYSKKYTTTTLLDVESDVMVEIWHNGKKLTDGANKSLTERLINEEGR